MTKAVTKKCRVCGRRTRHTVKRGRLRPDPKHPDDRAYDERSVTETCTECYATTAMVEAPNLLMEFFPMI